MRTIIVASGQPPRDDDWRRWMRDGDLVIGADGGAGLALQGGVVPGLVIGDMDSLSDADRVALEAQGVRFEVHPRSKDETDLELALTYAAQEGAKEIVVLGALGGRLDHTLSNVFLLALPQLTGLSVRIVDGGEETLLLRSGEATILEGQPGDLVSLLPVGGKAEGVTTTGLAWGLSGDTLDFGLSRGVSNVMLARSARVEVEAGYLLVVHSRPDVN